MIESPFDVKEVVFQRHYPGYLYRRELIDDSEYGGDGVEMKNCYSMYAGDWIGNSKDARFLCKKKGLRDLQKIKSEHCVCSLGWNESEQKWYGWSHRAIYGFGIGSKVKKGDCGYRPTDKNDFLDDCIRFWTGDTHKDVVAKFVDNGVDVSWVISDKVPNKKIRGDISSVFNEFPGEYGKGEWTAKTLEDAKQMAIDFAEGVS
jgi:hypothetical protein